jgi:adenine nucleotide transporter 17
LAAAAIRPLRLRRCALTAVPPARARRESLAEAIAGAFADLFSATVLYPLDVVKARTQTDKDATITSVVQQTGVLGLWRGVTDKWIVSPQQKFQYFYLENGLGVMFRTWAKREPSTAESLVIGYLSALQGTLTTIPLDVTSVRRLASKDRSKPMPGFWTSFREMADAEGFASFYAGWTVAAVLCINPAITFQVFDLMKQWWLKRTGSVTGRLSTAEAFAIGAVSKIIATYVTFPLIRIKAIVNTWTKFHPGESTPSATDAARRIVREEGVLGLYKGISTQLAKGVLNSAIMLATKEHIDKMVKDVVVGAM